jgi:hypothetical protein
MGWKAQHPNNKMAIKMLDEEEEEAFQGGVKKTQGCMCVCVFRAFCWLFDSK